MAKSFKLRQMRPALLCAAMLVSVLLIAGAPSLQKSNPGARLGSTRAPTQGANFSGKDVTRKLLSGQSPPTPVKINAATVIVGITTYVNQFKGTCFARNPNFSIGTIRRFDDELKDKIDSIWFDPVWLAKNAPSAKSAHQSGVFSATIYFSFDPRSLFLSPSQAQTMMHEVTHHIEWINGVKLPSKIVDRNTGQKIDNPISERNTNYQDKVVNALVDWRRIEGDIINKRRALMEGLISWKNLERSLTDLEAGSGAGGHRHDSKLNEMTGFNADLKLIRDYYLNKSCGDDFYTLIMVADKVPPMEWQLHFASVPPEVVEGDRATLEAIPWYSATLGEPEVKIPPELGARFQWKISDGSQRVGQKIEFTPTEAKPYTMKVELVVPFGGKEYAIAEGEYTLKVSPKKPGGSLPDLSGQWLCTSYCPAGGVGNPASIAQTGANLIFTNEGGDTSGGKFDGLTRVIATKWGNGNLSATIEDGGKELRWANGTIWRKRDAVLGNVWTVTEVGVWQGTWTRRAGTNVFDAVWRGPNGALVKDVIEFKSLQGNQIILYRRGNQGQYTGTISPDGTRITGTASWYEAGWKWAATISK